MFKPSKVEFENLFDELFETDKEHSIEIMNYVFNDLTIHYFKHR